MERDHGGCSDGRTALVVGVRILGRDGVPLLRAIAPVLLHMKYGFPCGTQPTDASRGCRPPIRGLPAVPIQRRTSGSMVSSCLERSSYYQVPSKPLPTQALNQHAPGSVDYEDVQ